MQYIYTFLSFSLPLLLSLHARCAEYLRRARYMSTRAAFAPPAAAAILLLNDITYRIFHFTSATGSIRAATDISGTVADIPILTPRAARLGSLPLSCKCWPLPLELRHGRLFNKARRWPASSTAIDIFILLKRLCIATRQPCYFQCTSLTCKRRAFDAARVTSRQNFSVKRCALRRQIHDVDYQPVAKRAEIDHQ